MLYIGLLIIFFFGYFAIIFENYLKINKAAVAILTGTVMWLYYFALTFDPKATLELFTGHIFDIAQVIFFIMAVMAIVELIDAHNGFNTITQLFYTPSKTKMLWFLVLLGFFMSSVLDNLTSLIVMVSLLRKLLKDKEDRWIFGSLMVIAVNAGGAWTPIGDVTTTLLWINEKISTANVMKYLFIPSVVNVVVATFLGMRLLKKTGDLQGLSKTKMEPGARRVMGFGLLALILIPVWKATLGLPPFMGALIGLGFLWLFTDLLHLRHGDKRSHLLLPHVFKKLDTSTLIFFLGILLAISALATAGILKDFARLLEQIVPTQNAVAVLIGLISSVVDNIPLVAATLGMYDYPLDHPLWLLIAYAAGTGGSILIIGSAAGVALMGLEKVDFIWYFKKISWIALIGYFAGILSYFLVN